ncbi:MAG: phosphotransferase [Acidimicrobiales bacterium]
MTDGQPDDPIPRLIRLAFGPACEVVDTADLNGGRGVFSRVVRAQLAWSGPAADRARSVAVKLPAPGPNGEAAAATGACRREALAYTRLIPHSPITTPRAWLVHHGPGAAASFVLEDLSGLRAVDQLDGLPAGDALAAAGALARFHRHWARPDRHRNLPLRRAVPAAIDPEALSRGLIALYERWGDVVDASQRAVFARLVARRAELVAAFAAAPATVCHGDPRADNLVFAPSGPVLFDWQQPALQLGAADVAWLAATSLTPGIRRTLDNDLAVAGGCTLDDYRTGLLLPGLAVLLLAQRVADSERTAAFIATSLRRIATAVADLELA